MPEGTHHVSIEADLRDDLNFLARSSELSPGRYLGKILTDYVADREPPTAPSVIEDGFRARVYVDDQTWAVIEQHARAENISVSVLASRLVAASRAAA